MGELLANAVFEGDSLTAGDSHRIIAIPTGTIRATDFNITPEQQVQLYENGRSTAEAFFADVPPTP